MKLIKERSIAVVFDAVSISKDIEILGGPLTQNFYSESRTYIPNRFITPILLTPKVYIVDPNNIIPSGDKHEELLECIWYENGNKIITNDEYKLNKDNTLTVLKNSEKDFTISYSAKWLDPRKKQTITIEDSVQFVTIALGDGNIKPRLTLDKAQNWIHNPLKNERIYSIKAYVSKDKLYEGAVEWYCTLKGAEKKLIDTSFLFYEGGQYSNELKVNSAYMPDCIITAKNISDNKLKEIYWFFDKHGNPLTYATPDKTIIEGKDIFNLPESPITSKLDYRIDGLTMEQLVKNGDFSKGRTGWELWLVESHKIDGDTITFRQKNPTGALIQKNLEYNIGDIIYISCSVKSETNTARLEYKQHKSYVSSTGVFNRLSIRVESEARTVEFNVLSDMVDGKFTDIYVKHPNIFNLTKLFGKGNEPTKEWCDEHIQGYFEGIKSVQTPMRIRSVGENLFNKLNIKRGYINFQNGNIVSINNFNSGYIRINNNTYYTNIKFNSGSAGYALYDKNKKFIGGGDLSSGVIINKVGACYCRFTIPEKENGIGWEHYEVDSVYLSKTKNYKPYTESNLYINNNLELKSVGGVKDYIENGKLYNNIGYIEDLSKLPIFSFNRYDNVNALNISFKNIDGGIRSSSEFMTNNYIIKSMVNPPQATESEIGKILIDAYFDRDIITYYVPKNYTDEQAVKELEGVSLYYIRRENKIIDLNTNGNLTTHPNGTIVIEPAVLVEKQYNDGLQVDLPVKSLTSIKVGAKYLDTSKAVVKDNLITHPELENGVFVTVEYIYDDSPIYGINSIGYLSLEEILDAYWLENVYTYKVTNGEWELVKVTDIEDYEEWLKTEKTSPYTLAPDGIIFGKYEANTKFLRQFPSSLYVDFIAPDRLKEGVTQIKARALVGTKDGVIDKPSRYFKITWLKRALRPGQQDIVIGTGDEILVDVGEKDAITIEIEDLGILKSLVNEQGEYLTEKNNKILVGR